MDAEQVRWFQFKPGVVADSLRVAHCASVTGGDEIASWCGLTFHPDDVEEVADPSSPPKHDKATTSAPCSICLLHLIAATDRSTKDALPPVTASEDSKLSVVLRKAQWLLDDAAFSLPQQGYSAADCTTLAETLAQLAALVRERAQRSRVIEPSEA